MILHPAVSNMMTSKACSAIMKIPPYFKTGWILFVVYFSQIQARMIRLSASTTENQMSGRSTDGK